MEHASQCFARLVCVLLGKGAVAESKLVFGRELSILGVDVSLSWRGYKCRPTPDKVLKWIRTIEAALWTMKLSAGDASKLAGRLSWGSAHMFSRFGRAMLRPLYDQKTRRDGKICAELRRALSWWLAVLQMGIVEEHAWAPPGGRPVHLFCDASGCPAHLGAVVYVDDECFWTHMAPGFELVSRFQSRRDNQIMGLELLAISLGLCTFEKFLYGRKIVVHCDNSGSEVSCLMCVLSPGSTCVVSFARLLLGVGLHDRGIMHNLYTNNGCMLCVARCNCSSSG